MKKTLSLVLAGTLCLALSTGALAASGFSDVPDGKWYTAEIGEMTAAGYIDGYEDGTFRPDGNVSVAEFVTITARCLGFETGAEYGHWAGRQMGNAYDWGWIDEQDAQWTQFNEPVSRQLAAKILASALGLEQGGEIPYADAADVEQNYVGWVGAVCSAGLIEGFEDNTFRPSKILSRAEAATLIYRASNAGDRLTAAPDGTPFASSVALAGYDNPNFKVTLSAGKATVVIDKAELWTDFADPDSPNAEEAAEGQRREKVKAAMKTERTIPVPGTVTAVYELPCTSWFPGTDANAVVGTSDGRWYFVELSGRNNDCVPELTELTALSGKSVSSLRWCTTSCDDDGVLFSGRDYIVAALADGSELIAFEH